LILVDTSVWVEHLRNSDAGLAGLLDANRVLIHPFVIGELALGRLRQRKMILGSLSNLPQAQTAADAEVLRFIEAAQLHGLGIGYIDAHLLASARLTPDCGLWTHDKRLRAAAERLGTAGGP
jgi:predicted nucleic acid-binding protein